MTRAQLVRASEPDTTAPLRHVLYAFRVAIVLNAIGWALRVVESSHVELPDQ